MDDSNADDLQPPGGAAWDEVPGLVARGFCMGTADVVPCVSGGTLALILGIYARLIRAIKSIDVPALRLLASRDWQGLHQHLGWRFLAAVVTGQALAVVVFTKVIPLPKWVVDPDLRQYVYAVFFGLIVGSIVTLGRDLLASLNGRRIAACAAGVAAALVIVNLTRGDTPETPLVVFLCGSVAICAMILPGISGSFVLLILGKYAYVMGSLSEFIKPSGDGGRLDPLVYVVIPFALGCLTGLLLFSRLLAWVLKRAEQATLAFMVGLMAGSLWIIWPFQDPTFATVRGKQKLVGSTPLLPTSVDGAVALTVVLALVGVAAVLLLERLASRGGESAA